MQRLLNGLSWSALGLVAVFCALQATEWVLEPTSGVIGLGASEVATAWFSRLWVFLVSGLTIVVTALAVLNSAGRAGRESFWVAAAATVLAAFAAAFVRYAIGATPANEGAAFMVMVFISWLGSGAILVAGYVFYLRARAAEEEFCAAELRGRSLETQQLATRLRLLQAQVEPHFIFNTLSNVRRLAQTDAAAGRAMLAQLTRYLRGALPRMREDETTLGDELELVRAYLGLQQTRMGARLDTTIDVPAELTGCRVPPMMLLTLVENAIKHGIAPLAEGGRIALSAERRGDALVLAVADTGRGLVGETGTGVGLANIRARLAALYGAGAELRLQGNAPRGVLAEITVPVA